MSEQYEVLRAALSRSIDLQNEHNHAVHTYATENTRQHEEMWQDIADLRDSILALSNRLEALTSYVTTEPVEVAEKIVRLADE